MLNPLSKEAREVVWGSLLGDGGIFLGTGNRHYCYKESHSPKQRKYLEWKYNFLKPVVGSKIYSVTRFHKRNQRNYTTIQFTTKALSYFTRLRKIFYPHGKKLIRRKILNKLTPLGLATWFMDDGSTTKNNRGYPQLYLNICSCSQDEGKTIVDYLKEVFGIEARLCVPKYPKIYFNRPNGQKLVDIIRPHFIPAMFYKLRYFSQTNPIRENPVEDIV